MLVPGMVGSAHTLKAIVEGVETEAQLSRLGEIDCDLAQGYFVSQPLPVEAASDLLRHQ